MKTFILVLTLFADGQCDYNYVIDHNLTGEDCITKLLAIDEYIRSVNADAACEIERNIK